MFVIIHLARLEDGNYQSSPTDYDPMMRDEACQIVTELTNDAIDSESSDRWTIIKIGQSN